MGMVRRSGKETQKMFKAVVVLLRNTTWKCGKVERLVVEYLQSHLMRYGTPKSSIKEMAQNLNLKGKQRSEFFDALKRLERRHIIEIKIS
jgi:transcription initiation factor TFIIIB Brf1 subunit/transcription initiation factor TFIIB